MHDFGGYFFGGALDAADASDLPGSSQYRSSNLAVRPKAQESEDPPEPITNLGEKEARARARSQKSSLKP